MKKEELKTKIFKVLKIMSILICIGSLSTYILALPMKKDDDLTCLYSNKYNKITCTQIGDIVPTWFDLYGSNHSMLLILKKDSSDYITLNMTDKVFIEGLNRKFIYTKHEQTLKDFIKLKFYSMNSSMSNWGSVALYCSENNLNDDICKKMKKYNK